MFSFLIALSSCDQAVKDYASSAVPPLSLANNGKPVVQWSVASQIANKSAAANLTVTAKLSTPATQPVSLAFAFSGTAVLNSDFSTTAPSTLTIAAGQSSSSFQISVINDGLAGANKKILVTATNPVNAVIGSIGVQTITIVNDIAANLSVALSSMVTEGATASFVVTLSPISTQTVQVQYTTSNGTAVSGTNYTLTSGTLTFNPGVSTQSINVLTQDVGVYFPIGKTYSVTLSAPVNASLASAIGTGTINSNHPQPSVQWTLATQSTNKSAAATLTVTAQLSAASGVATSIPFTLGGTGVLSTDYSISPASPLSIAAGSTTATTSVTIINDSVAGSNKTITLTMGAPTNASLGATSLQTITIVNDLLSAFSITGITGASDATLDAFLNLGVNPTINWGTSTNATSYDVTVYQNDGTTVQCALVNTAATSYAFSGCTLTAGQNYKAKVTAKGTAPSVNATNNLYSFFVNSPPTAATIATHLVLNTDTIVTDVVTGAACAFAGCTIAITSSANGAGGTTSFSGNNITYTPSSGFSGTDTFSYVINDGRGGVATGTINLKVMTPFTWSGGGGNVSWATTNNWCGTINAGKTACVGGPQPGASDTAIFDGTCTANCSPTMNAAVNIGGIQMNSGYIGTITQGTGFTISVGTGAWTQNSGTFIGSTSGDAITIYNLLTIQAGTFKSTSGTLAIVPSGAYASVNYLTGVTATFIPNGGILSMDSACNTGQFIAGSSTYNSVSFGGTCSNVSLGGGTLTMTGNLVIKSVSIGSTLNSGNIFVGGNVTTTGPLPWSGSAIIKLTGNAAGQTITSVSSGGPGGLPNLTIAAGTNPVTLVGNLYIAQNYIMTSSGAFTATGSTLSLSGDCTGYTLTPGTVTYNNVSIGSQCASYDLGGGTMTISGTLNFPNPGYNSAVNNGTLAVAGNVTTTGPNITSGSALVNLTGNASGQTVTGTTNGSIPSLKITAGTNAVTLSGQIGMANYTYTSSGTFTTTGSTLNLRGSSHTSSGETLNIVNFGGGCTAMTLTGTIRAAGSVNFNDPCYGYLNGGTLLVGGNLSVNNWGGGSTAITLNGTALQTITQSGGSFPSGNFTLTNAAGAQLGANLTMTSGQTTSITSGNLNMAGFNLNLSTLVLSPTTSVTRNGGVLTVGGSAVVGPAPYSGGNISN